VVVPLRLCALSVDLDEIGVYAALHGLSTPEGRAQHAVYDLGLDRLDEFARAHELPLSLFAVGLDLQRSENANRLRRAAESGYEIGNHSLGHRMDLTRLGHDEMLGEVQAGADMLLAATGQRPVGFRAPGYTVTDELFGVLGEAGMAYDSSVFPCPAYYLAKAATRLGIRLRGRQSNSVLDTPAVLGAPTEPYRVGRPYTQRGNGMLELPIQVTRGPRLPFIGTALTLAGPDRARWLTKLVVGKTVVNLELHGIDALDQEDGLAFLRPHQPDVRVPVARKLAALGAVVETLAQAGYAFVRLDEVAARVGDAVESLG
jgi:peptidoglycan/xylan/chitin deacetylase (PgdA/CDA1 family)